MLQLHVEGMSCNHCVKAVTNAVTELDANAKVDVNLEKALVSIDSTASEAAIIEALDEAGYPAKVSS